MKIVITGVSKGLGRYLAIELLRLGHDVWGISRKEREHSEIKNLFQYPNFIYSACDLTSESHISRFAEEIAGRNFPVDVLVLNAALMGNDYVNGVWDFEKFREIMEVNFMGAANLTAKLLPSFQQREKGIILGISSISSIRALLMDKIAYAPSKSALNMMFESLRLQLGYSYPGIRFITFNPGPLEQRDQIFSSSYSHIGRKIISIIENNKYKDIYTYPLMSSIIYKVFQLIPDRFIARYIIQPRRKHKEKQK
ncbi:MAG: SDR family oxidoreductase [Nitrospirae bacterium]|nr:SDR family oxidoreductase [Nitrospirota bacterium]